MARRRHSNRRHRGGFSVLYKLLSTLAICAVILVALTLFFRVNTIVVTGQQRYSEQEVIDATGIQTNDNLYLLLNKNEVANRMMTALPYLKSVRINRKLPDTLLIEVEECGTPLAVVQDGSAWLVSPGDKVRGRVKIVDQVEASAAADYGIIDGCTLLAPSVGGQLALATEYVSQQESLVALLQALEDAEMLDQVEAIHLGDASAILMDYGGRFKVQMPYGADYAVKLRALRQSLENEMIQENMTGTFDLMQDSGDVYFKQEAR